ncbi:3-isopropylmalate dehydratase small subunit [candidate division BRC1 bacterium HGW-BRC1-1]|jgi:3-isopropylmalate/(R)-2-methylmalate dehydratase small subunit|nr:MAG: 3-isopropylmalate dehydratase small subunit [candidate division BRC1 bacterium HGW-BRC1-1]
MGKVVYEVGNDISTDAIYPGRFMATVLPSETPQFAFADEKEFNAKLTKGEVADGDILLAANNFGCGSSREQAASCLKGYGVIVVARGFARIFMQNAVNLGLQTVVAPEIEASVGDELEITQTEVINHTTGKSYATIAHPPARQAIIDAGGLIAYARKKLLEEKGVKSA